MPVLSDYTSGTISLAKGSVTVTGTGTLFEVTRFQEGDTLQIQNLTAVIASVDSDTQLTLTEPWTGTDIVDGPYRARQLGDGSRVSTQAATVIELLGNGVLTNLAELGVEEGKTPVGGPTGEYELVDTSSFGVQDPNGSLGKLAALTLAARQILQTDETGALKAFSLVANKWLTTDANGDLAMIDPQTIVGGSNANGQFVRLPDGTQLCRGTVNFSGGGGATVTGTWTFPAAFSGSFPISAGFRMLAPPASGVRERSYWGNPAVASQVIFAMSVNTSFPSGFSESAECWASGRWS